MEPIETIARHEIIHQGELHDWRAAQLIRLGFPRLLAAARPEHRSMSTEGTMRFSVKAHHLPQRVATGAFILNSGIGKLRADEEAAAQLHGFAAGAYPFVNKLKPADFTRLLAVGEITLGAAL